MVAVVCHFYTSYLVVQSPVYCINTHHHIYQEHRNDIRKGSPFAHNTALWHGFHKMLESVL